MTQISKDVARLQNESKQASKAVIAAEKEYRAVKQKLDAITSKKLPLEKRLNQLQQTVQSHQNLEKQGDELLQNILQLSKKSIEYCKEFPQKYQTHWDVKEQVWYYWGVDDIADWIVYKLDTNDTSWSGLSLKQKKDHLVNMKNELEDMKYHGSYLRAVTIDKLKQIGFNREKDQDIRDWLYKEIHTMCDTYPMPIEKSNTPDDSNDGSTIENDLENEDERFLCPLSGELMNDPVIAMDGNTYENQMIIDYLRQNGRFPNGEKCENVELAIQMLQENMPLKQEIERKYRCDPPPAKRQRMSK